MTTILAQKALLPDGWADAVTVTVAGDTIARVDNGATGAHVDIEVDCLLPGLSNAHSHAFQRALAGRTEERSPAGFDNFWTWRERMYALAGNMQPELLRAVARQAYVEMLTAGFTAVAEFHYLHRAPGCNDDDESMFQAIRDAARDAGIRLAYVPVLYERAGFESAGPDGAQRQFATGLDAYLAHVERVAELDGLHLGIGAHSIRAVSAASLGSVAEKAQTLGIPMHVHVAEQQREVDESMLHYGTRPVDWLLREFDVDERWCLVHATHIDGDELQRLAATRAVVCLCPSTEANLGDGLFPLREFLERDGIIAIGSDSHISINAFEELRWLEYGQRLVTQTRNVAATRNGHVGRELFDRAVAGGAAACGRRVSGIVAGADADLLCLNGEDPMIVGHDDKTRLDALVFSGYRLPIERVMVAGVWQVTLGEHERAADARSEFAIAVRALAEVS